MIIRPTPPEIKSWEIDGFIQIFTSDPSLVASLFLFVYSPPDSEFFPLL